ncbi:MAG: substrate-binding domain-containing protein [Bacteroidota bacterium]|nr:substrate-binding domain-containing protein [Bacteroidota bacterium]
MSAGGAGKGMVDALSGMVDLGMFSREVSAEEEAQGAWKTAVAKDAVLATCNAKNPNLPMIRKQGLSKKAFADLFLLEKVHYWKDYFKGANDSRINVYTRSDACGAAQMWGLFLGASQEALHGIGVFGDPGMADAVKNDRMGLGYNNVVYIYDIQSRKKYQGLEVIPIDLNGDGRISPDEDFYGSLDSVMTAIKNNVYPSPPARALYFVSKGQPKDELVKLFLEWILTAGQNFVSEAGYVKLAEDKIQQELKRLQ